MEEILKELIQTTLEKGPQNKQFYSNLSITKPIHDHAEIQLRLADAVTFLQSSLKPGRGFQSELYTSRNCAIKSANICGALRLHNDTVEVLTSVLAVDLLFNTVDNERFVAPHFQEIICNFSNEIQDELHNLIVPSCGISTFNLFKQLQPISPVSFPPSPIDNPYHDQLNSNECFDSGNDSPISMFSSNTNPDANSSENAVSIIDSFPDDINTSMLTLYVLVHQGILQAKPVESVLQWIISNVFNFEDKFNEETEASPDNSAESTTSATSVATFPTFITRQGSSDPVGVANVLNLMYLLDISHEVFLNAAEEFIVTTLEKSLSVANADEAAPTAPSISSSPEVVNTLGNTHTIISSEDNNGREHCSIRNDEEAPQVRQAAFVLQHHSPDSLLYFLSRALAISPAPNNCNSANCRRPYITQMKSLLLNLLDARLGTTMNTLDLAMRILTGVYLGVVNVSNNSTNLHSDTQSSNNCGHQAETLHHRPQQNERHCSSLLSYDIAKMLRINNLLQKEFELLVSLQTDEDGSWQADSIVQIGFYENDNNDYFANTNGESCNDGYSHGIGTMGYLGGREMATLFAVKAIAVYLSWKKGTFTGDTGEGWCDPNSFNYVDVDADLHKLY